MISCEPLQNSKSKLHTSTYNGGMGINIPIPKESNEGIERRDGNQSNMKTPHSKH
jgi:hypothetical protein